eukprot:scaffold387729_cov24-Prasinocladus_malaysianus.AAC.1
MIIAANDLATSTSVQSNPNANRVGLPCSRFACHNNGASTVVVCRRRRLRIVDDADAAIRTTPISPTSGDGCRTACVV